MRTFKFTICISMIMLGLLSCSDTKDDAIVQEPEVLIDLEQEIGFNENPYIWEWSIGKRYVSYSETRSLVVFYEKNRKALFARLTELGISFSEEDVNELRKWLPRRRIKDGPGINNFDDCYTVMVNADFKSLEHKLPEAYFISPYISIRPVEEVVIDDEEDFSWNRQEKEFSTNNLITVHYIGSMGSLESIVKRLGIEIVMQDSNADLGVKWDTFLLWCTPESHLNVLEIADKLYKTGKFIAVELPPLMVATLE